MPANNLGNEGIFAMINAASLGALEELDLSGRGVSERYNDDPIVRSPGMESLAGWAGLASVRSLNLSGNLFGRAGLRALLRSPHAGSLKELVLRGSQLDGQAMAEFDSALPGLRLESLDLGENVLKDVGAEYVALVPCLSELKALRLDRCEITLTGARLFAKKARFLGGLRQLEVGHNHFGAAGVGALLEREPPSLHTLQMRDNDLFDKGASLLAESPASGPLLELDLSQNGLGTTAVEALGASPHLGGLLVLRLVDNPINSPFWSWTTQPHCLLAMAIFHFDSQIGPSPRHGPRVARCQNLHAPMPVPPDQGFLAGSISVNLVRSISDFFSIGFTA